MTRRLGGLVVCLTIMSQLTLAGQTKSPVEPSLARWTNLDALRRHEMVNVFTTERDWHGPFVSVDAISLTLRVDGRDVTVPRASVALVDHVVTRAKQRGITGAVVGGAVGLLLGSLDDRSGQGATVLGSAAALGLAGVLLGARETRPQVIYRVR